MLYFHFINKMECIKWFTCSDYFARSESMPAWNPSEYTQDYNIKSNCQYCNNKCNIFQRCIIRGKVLDFCSQSCWENFINLN